jgi:hypothetical protein
MNSSYGESRIEKMLKKNQAVRSDFLAEFRVDIESYLSREDIELVMKKEQTWETTSTNRYQGFVDLSGGRNDSAALAIGHVENDKCVLDLCTERIPPFSPAEIVREFCEILKKFRISKVQGDRYAGEWPVDSFRKQGEIVYEPAAMPKNDYFLEFSPLVRMGQVVLIKNEKLLQQLSALERHTGKSGRDEIVKVAGFHDDLSNAVAGCLVNLKRSEARHLTEKEIMARLPRMSGDMRPPAESFEEEAYRICTDAMLRGEQPPLDAAWELKEIKIKRENEARRNASVDKK